MTELVQRIFDETFAEEVHQFDIFYPSRNVGKLTGRWRGYVLLSQEPKSLSSPVIESTIYQYLAGSLITANSMVVLDPRCIITIGELGDRFTIYSPRFDGLRLDSWVTTWLAENPHWPKVLEL